MCIGIPMQVVQLEPGHALCAGQGEVRRVRTALIGPCQPGDWLLVFIDSAQEILSPERACEINDTLALLQAALAGDAGTEPAFALPSSLSRDELMALSGHPAPTPSGEPV